MDRIVAFDINHTIHEGLKFPRYFTIITFSLRTSRNSHREYSQQYDQYSYSVSTTFHYYLLIVTNRAEIQQGIRPSLVCVISYTKLTKECFTAEWKKIFGKSLSAACIAALI
jgi:hypothetical protein